MTVRMRVFRTGHPIRPGWLWACSDTTTHGSRNGDDWPSWLPPCRTAEEAADIARSHWRNWHGPWCGRCHTGAIHRVTQADRLVCFACACGRVMEGASP